jgi:nucleotide-binding universal stress UspA family protein
MYKHILIPTDVSELSDQAVREGIQLAKSINAKLTCLYVSPPVHTAMTEGYLIPAKNLLAARHNEACETHAREVLDPVRKFADREGVACETVQASSDHPYEAIIDTAKTHKCDLIMMASHGRRGFQGVVLGSETNKVLTHSDIPVLVVRQPAASVH